MTTSRIEIMEQFKHYSKFASRKSADGLRPETISSYTHYLGLYLDSLENRSALIDRVTFSIWLSSLPLMDSTKNYISGGLTKFLAFFKYLSDSDVQMIKQSFYTSRVDWSDKKITDSQIEELLVLVGKRRTTYVDERNILMVFLMSTLGLRVGQVLLLDIADLVYNVATGFYEVSTVDQKINTRTTSKRTHTKKLPRNYALGQFIAHELIDKYMAMRMEREPNNPALFITSMGNRCSRENVWTLVHNVGKRMGVELHPHALRHYVGHKVTNELGITKASILLGHKNINTTRYYVNADEMEILV